MYVGRNASPNLMPILTCSSALAGAATLKTAKSTMKLRNPRRKATLPSTQRFASLPSTPPSCPQYVHAEEAVGEHLHRRPAIFARQGAEGLDRIFVAVFRVDGLARPKIDRRAIDPHRLVLGTGKVHLDAALPAIEERVVLERREVEIGAELTVHPRQEIEVETGRYPFSVVISAIECLFVLCQIDANHKQRTGAQHLADMA